VLPRARRGAGIGGGLLGMAVASDGGAGDYGEILTSSVVELLFGTARRKDRLTLLPPEQMADLRRLLLEIRRLHQGDLQLAWQWVFPEKR